MFDWHRTLTATFPSIGALVPRQQMGMGSCSRHRMGGVNCSVRIATYWDTIEQAVAIFETPSEGETITYKHREPRSIVISGTRGDRIYYAKSMLSCRDNVWISVWIEYPAACRETFDSPVKQVAGSLGSGHSYQVAECDK